MSLAVIISAAAIASAITFLVSVGHIRHREYRDAYDAFVVSLACMAMLIAAQYFL